MALNPPPVYPDKMEYKFIADGRWMTNDAEPIEIDHGFINNVYTALHKPVLPYSEPSTAWPSYQTWSTNPSSTTQRRMLPPCDS
jgi:hypothetical protein